MNLLEGRNLRQQVATSRTVPNATLARRHLSASFFQVYFRWGGCTCEQKITLSLKRHLFPDSNSVKMLAPGFVDLVDVAPISNILPTFELSTKAAFAKAAFDNLRIRRGRHLTLYFPKCFWITVLFPSLLVGKRPKI